MPGLAAVAASEEGASFFAAALEAASDGADVCGWAGVGAGFGGGTGLGLLSCSWTAEGADGRSSCPKLWVNTPATNKMLPRSKMTPQNFMHP